MEELIPLLPKLAEYGAVGIIAGASLIAAKMYLPHFALLAKALQDLPPALSTLVERIEDIEEGLGEVRRELAVIRDRLPRDGSALLQAYLQQPASRK